MTDTEIEETIMALQDRVSLLRRRHSPSTDMARSALRKLTAARQRRFRRDYQAAQRSPTAAQEPCAAQRMRR